MVALVNIREVLEAVRPVRGGYQVMVTDCRMQTAAVSVAKAGRCWATLVVVVVSAGDPVWPDVVETVVPVASRDG